MYGTILLAVTGRLGNGGGASLESWEVSVRIRKQTKLKLRIDYYIWYILLHQENSSRLERLAPDTPDAARLPYLVWRHNDGRDAIKISCARIQF